MKKWLFLIFRLVVSAALIYFLVTKIDFFTIFLKILPSLPLYLLFVNLIVYLLRIWISSVRWKILNTDFTFQLSNWDYFRYSIISNTYSVIMPGLIGGDIIKAIYIGKDLKSYRTRNILSILFDRLIGMFSLIIACMFFLMISSLFQLKIKIICFAVFLFMIALILSFLFLIKKNVFYLKILKWEPKKNFFIKLKNVITVFREIVIFYISKPRIVLYAFILSFIIHIIGFLLNYITTIFLGMNITFFDISAVNSLVLLIASIPVSISGIGVREFSFVNLLGKYGISPESATALALYFFGIAIILAILGIPLIIISRKQQKNL